MVKHSSVQARIFENLRADRINRLWRRHGLSTEAGKPAGNVITVGIEVLHGVDHPSKRLPGCPHITARKTGEDGDTLLLNVGIGCFDPVIVKMVLVTSNLVNQAVLSHIGAQNDLEGMRTNLRANGLTGDINVIANQHVPFVPRSD